MSDNTLRRVEQACTDLLETGEQVTFTAVAARTQLARTTLYRNQRLRAVNTAPAKPRHARCPASPARSPTSASPSKPSPPPSDDTKNSSANSNDAPPPAPPECAEFQGDPSPEISRSMLG
jgi:hypothetical protein